MKNIVVTFKVEDIQRQFINSLVDKNASVKYLQDFSKEEITGVLKYTDILFAWNPPRELHFSDPDSFTKLKFMQVLSAGYDQIDFNMFPSSLV